VTTAAPGIQSPAVLGSLDQPRSRLDDRRGTIEATKHVFKVGVIMGWRAPGVRGGMTERADFARQELPVRELMIGAEDRALSFGRRLGDGRRQGLPERAASELASTD
jgi:hypothetical protein